MYSVKPVELSGKNWQNI